MKQVIPAAGPLSGGQPGQCPGADEFKQVENCFLNHNSSIHFGCTDSSLLMTHRDGLIWRIGEGGPSFLLWPHKWISNVDTKSDFEMMLCACGDQSLI